MAAPTLLIWNIALRQLAARRRQTLTVTGGVVLGITVLLASMALFGGLLANFTAKVIDATPHVTLTAENSAGNRGDVLVGTAGAAVQLDKNADRQDRPRMRNVMPTLQAIRQQLGPKLRAASPFLSTQALAAFGVIETTLPITGVIPEEEANLSGLRKYMLSGTVERLTATYNGILLGIKAANDLGVHTGERIRLVSLSGDVFTVQVTGIYELGFQAADRTGLVNLRFAQGLEHALPDEAGGISFQLYDVNQATEVSDRIESITGRKADTWQETNAGFIAIFTFLRNLFFVVTGFVIVICGFGIANILITSVLEKQRDIAVMKSFGFSRRDLSLMYLMQGVLIALAGSLTGCLTGAGIIALMGSLPGIDQNNSVAAFKSDSLPVVWDPWFFVIAVASITLISIIAAVAPARSAANVIPVSILRGER